MTTTEFLKKIEPMRYKYGVDRFLSDSFKLWAIKLSNTVDVQNRERRATMAQELENRYSESDVKLIYSMLGDIMAEYASMIDSGEFSDLLGEIYMQSNTSSKQAGQFFTPFNISRLMAAITVADWDLSQDIITINDPACGSSGTIIAALEYLYQKGIHYTDRVLAVVNDIDDRCGDMSYIQLSLLGVPAVVMRGDTFTQKFTEVWYTPAYILQFNKFERHFKNLRL